MKTQKGTVWIPIVLMVVTVVAFTSVVYATWQFQKEQKAETPDYTKSVVTHVDKTNTNSSTNTNTSTTNTNTTSNTNTSTTTSAGMTVITEWNVEFPTPAGMSDLTYTIATSGGARFITQQLIDEDQAKTVGTKYCTVEQGGHIGVLSRTTNKASLTASGKSTNLKIGDYYYWFEGPQASCSSNQEVATMQSQQSVKLRTAIETGLQ